MCNGLNESLTSIVAAESLSTWQTIQIVTLDMFLMHRLGEEGTAGCEDEREVVALICEAISGMLSAFLLPVYTLKQGASLLDYFALPATKIILDWIVLNPKVLEERGFLKRLQIWPSLCRVLNNLSELLAVQEKDDNFLSDLDEYPLPEDHDLQVRSHRIYHLCTVVFIYSFAIFCYVFLWKLRGPAWVVGSCSSSPPAGVIPQIHIFKTLRMSG